MQPPAEPLEETPRLPNVAAAQHLLWPAALPSAIFAGVLAIVVIIMLSAALSAAGSSSAAMPLLVLAIFASGALTVTFYRRRSGSQAVTPWMGAKLGLLTGSLSALTVCLMIGSVLFSAAERAQFRSAMHLVTEQAVANAVDTQARQALEAMGNYVTSDSGLTVFVLSILAFFALSFLFFSALGGFLGAAFFGHESHPRRL